MPTQGFDESLRFVHWTLSERDIEHLVEVRETLVRVRALDRFLGQRGLRCVVPR